jgi:hypothetical protein
MAKRVKTARPSGSTAAYRAQTNNSRLITPLDANLNPTCHLLALLGARHILHVSRVRVKLRKTEIQGICLFHWW